MGNMQSISKPIINFNPNRWIENLGSHRGLLIMNQNMLANGLQDKFLRAITMKIFFSSSDELKQKKGYFVNLHSNIKQLFFKSNSKKSLSELEQLFKQTTGESKEDEDESIIDPMDQYNLGMLSLYEKCLAGMTKETDLPSKRIKNISNSMWRIIFTKIMKTNKSFNEVEVSEIVLNKKYTDKFPEVTDQQITELKERILCLGNSFINQYTTYKEEVAKYQEEDKIITPNIKEYLRLRFEIFKQMVQYYSPDIMCLQEDDFDHYFKNDQWFSETYGFARCKKVPSRAQIMLREGTGCCWTNKLNEREDSEFAKTVYPDGVTIMYKKSLFHDPEPERNYQEAAKDKSPFLLKKLIRRDTGEVFFVLTAHLESGKDDYSKEGIRMDDIDDILNDPYVKKMWDEIMDKKNNFIVCMDANAPFLDKERFDDYYGNWCKFEPGEIVIDGKQIAKNSAMYKLMREFGLTKSNVCVDSPTDVYSVNRFRGCDSEQLAKLMELEYHCIDHGFARLNGNYELLKTYLPKMVPDDFDNLLPNFETILNPETKEIKVKDLTTGPCVNNWGPPLVFENGIPKVKPYLPGFLSISDHLPLLMYLMYRP